MVIYNSITGLVRKLPRNKLPRKKRNSHGSTVSGRLYSEQALEVFKVYVTATGQNLCFVAQIANIHSPRASVLSMFFVVAAAFFYTLAGRMLLLDSELMDIGEEQRELAGYHYPLIGITIDSYKNNDECEDFTQFTKEELHTIN
jgi:hypothetical protein